MENTPHDIKYSTTSLIDRIAISVPIASYSKFRLSIEKNSTHIDSFPSRSENFLINKYNYKGNTFQVIHRIVFEKKQYYNQRFYIQLLQPDLVVQRYIRNTINEVTPVNIHKQYNPCINQVEITYDFFTDTDYSLYFLHEFLSKHINLKYARKGSVGKCKETSYRGKGKMIYAGRIGSRCYIKRRSDADGEKEFCRLEIQMNRKTLRDNCITIDDLPLTPDKIQGIEFFEILDDFSAKEIRNITRTIMRKNESKYYNDPKSFRFLVKEQLLRSQIYGAFFKDDYVSVPEQIERCNEIKKKHGLTLNPKKHCQRLFTIREFVSGIQ